MSGNKRINFDTKITEDENIDSGFLSGPLDVYPGDEEDKEAERQSASEDKKVLSDSAVQPSDSELDSGILCLSECLSGVQLTDTQTPHIEVSPPEQKNLPPIVIFFQQDADGDTQLHIASVHGCEKSVGTLIRVCPNKALLDVANDDGHTPLHLAVMSGNAVVTRMLVHAGLSLGARDRKGETPLHKATTKGHIECLQALLAPVPEHPRTKLSSVLDQKNYKGQACVHLAASSGNIEALQTLVYYGADINLRENLGGSTALHIAARLHQPLRRRLRLRHRRRWRYVRQRQRRQSVREVAGEHELQQRQPEGMLLEQRAGGATPGSTLRAARRRELLDTPLQRLVTIPHNTRPCRVVLETFWSIVVKYSQIDLNIISLLVVHA